jgi:UDP-N-acetylmuramate dehydrogenase
MTAIESLNGIRLDVIIAPYTTYKIGGPADYFYEPQTIEELEKAVKVAQQDQIPYFLLGTGANILVSDKGFRGLVIHNLVRDYSFDRTKLTTSSGTIISDLVELTASRSLSSFEHFTGIPSTVGGALWQNLHFLAPDREHTVYIGDILIGARILHENGNVQDVEASFFEFGYDQSKLHEDKAIVLSATFQLTEKPEEEIRKQIKANLDWRNEKQPQLDEFPSCGSVFKKIEGVGAGRLIEHDAKMKGVRIGNVEVSNKHANYLVNLGGATATDVKALIDKVHDTVKEKTGYDLQLEISLVGEW